MAEPGSPNDELKNVEDGPDHCGKRQACPFASAPPLARWLAVALTILTLEAPWAANATGEPRPTARDSSAIGAPAEIDSSSGGEPAVHDSMTAGERAVLDSMPAGEPATAPDVEATRTPIDSLLLAIVELEYARTADPEDLAPFLAHPSPRVRSRATLAAARLADPRLSEWVLPLLRDPESPVREMAAFAAGYIADSTAIDLLIGATGDRVTGVAEQATLALGRVGSRVASEHLASWLLIDPRPAVRRAAALALARLADPAHAEAVIAALAREEDPATIGKLLYAIERTPGGTPAGAIASHLSASSPLVRAAAARALGRHGSHASHAALSSALDDPEWRVRVNAVRSLAALHADVPAGETVPELVACLDDPVHHVREAAALALGEFGLPEAGEPLLAASTDSVAGVRRAAVTAIARVLGEQAAPTLITRIDDPSPYVAQRAVTALAEAVGRDAYDTLAEKAASGQSLIAMAAAEALGTLGEPAAIGPLVDLLTAGDWVVAATAAEALKHLGDDAAERALLAALDRWHGFDENTVRVSILGALGRLGGSRSFEGVAGALMDPDPRVRVAAQAAADSMSDRGIELDPDLLRARSLSRELASGPPPLGNAPRDFPLAEPPEERRARIVTWRGVIELELLPEIAPMAVASFVRLAKSGFYDHAVFHRVVPDFVIQGGCPRHDGYGGPDYALRGEISMESYGVGTVGMADAGMDTAGSQFFITHSPVPRLDGRYTAFARVTAGIATVDRIQQGDSFRVEIVPPDAYGSEPRDP